jgi:hypothetical protein
MKPFWFGNTALRRAKHEERVALGEPCEEYDLQSAPILDDWLDSARIFCRAFPVPIGVATLLGNAMTSNETQAA